MPSILKPRYRFPLKPSQQGASKDLLRVSCNHRVRMLSSMLSEMRRTKTNRVCRAREKPRPDRSWGTFLSSSHDVNPSCELGERELAAGRRRPDFNMCRYFGF